MRYRSSIPKSALRTVEQVLEDMAEGRIPDDLRIAGKNPAAVALGRKGGLKGGHARAATLTAERRADIARKAATARWSSKKG